MSFLKNKWVLIALAILVVIGLRMGCKKDDTLKVATEKVAFRSITETVDENGKIFPTIEVPITAEPGAIVQQLLVQEGDTVRQGDAIATIQTDGTSVVAAKAANPNAAIQKAMQGGTMNPAAIAQALQQVNQAPANPTLKRVVKTTTLYAPMSGTVSNLTARKGDRIMSSQIATISGINEWEVRADIGEMDIVKIKSGNGVRITIDALPNAQLEGTVSRITSNNSNTIGSTMLGGADVTNYKVFVKINKTSLDSILNKKNNYTLRSGMSAGIKIATNTKDNILTVPIKAVTTRYENEQSTATTDTKKAKSEIVVFVYNNGVAKKKVVTIGIQNMEYIEVISGLQNGESIITEPYEAIEKKLKNDLKVKEVSAAILFNDK